MPGPPIELRRAVAASECRAGVKPEDIQPSCGRRSRGALRPIPGRPGTFRAASMGRALGRASQDDMAARPMGWTQQLSAPGFTG